MAHVLFMKRNGSKFEYCVNTQHVTYIESIGRDDACKLYFTGGQPIEVKGSLEETSRALQRADLDELLDNVKEPQSPAG